MSSVDSSAILQESPNRARRASATVYREPVTQDEIAGGGAGCAAASSASRRPSREGLGGDAVGRRSRRRPPRGVARRTLSIARRVRLVGERCERGADARESSVRRSRQSTRWRRSHRKDSRHRLGERRGRTSRVVRAIQDSHRGLQRHDLEPSGLCHRGQPLTQRVPRRPQRLTGQRLDRDDSRGRVVHGVVAESSGR